MKKVAIFTILSLFFTTAVFSEPRWQKIDPTPPISSSSIVNSITAVGSFALGSVSGDPFYNYVRSSDGGGFFGAFSATPAPPQKLKSLSPTFLYGLRNDSILTSVDQGLSWLGRQPALAMSIADVHFVAPANQLAWAVGKTAVRDTPIVAKTSNGWASVLQRQTLPLDSILMISVQFLDDNFGFAVGRSTKAGPKAAVIFRTTDGGLTWQLGGGLPDTCGGPPLLAADFISPKTGWAVQTCPAPLTAFVYKTTDSGQTWTPQDTFTSIQLRALAIDAVDSLYVWIAGASGLSGAIVKSSNGGANWAQEPSVPASSGRLLSLDMLDSLHGYASGESGTILVYAPVATDVPRDRFNRPKSFELSQNYPNPFNAGTKISFSLLKKENVKLTVFNILGEPVAVLFQGPLSAGRHEFNWNGADAGGKTLSTGLYLYELRTAEERDVRKMVLLK